MSLHTVAMYSGGAAGKRKNQQTRRPANGLDRIVELMGKLPNRFPSV